MKTRAEKRSLVFLLSSYSVAFYRQKSYSGYRLQLYQYLSPEFYYQNHNYLECCMKKKQQQPITTTTEEGERIYLVNF